MDDISLFFWLTEFICLVTLYYFNRRLLSLLSVSLMTAPYLFFSYAYFVVAPAFNVAFDTYIDRSLFHGDPVWALALLNIVNSIGLLCAYFGVAFADQGPSGGSSAAVNGRMLIAINLILLPVSIFYGIYFLYLSGGLYQDASGKLVVEGSIFNFILIGTAPILFCWTTATYFVLSRKRPPHLLALLIILVHLILVLSMNSARGSRVSMLIQLILAAQIYGLSILRFRFLHYAAAAIFLALFLPTYAYYKYAGFDAFYDYVTGRGPSEVAAHYNDPVTFVVGDIGRADIQAPILMGVLDGIVTPNYFGESYVAGALLILPTSLRPNWAKQKISLGEEAQFKLSGRYNASSQVNNGQFASSRIYGLLGEALLNFGIFAVPAAFFLFGFLSRRCFLRVSPPNSWGRVLTAPFFALFPVYMLFYDFDNIVFQTIVVWSLPALLLLLCMISAKKAGHI